MIRLKIDVTKIDKEKLFRGEKGIYLDATLIETPDNRYGDDYMIVQDVGKEARMAGEKGEILGNGKIIGQRQPQQTTNTATTIPVLDDGSDAIPF